MKIHHFMLFQTVLGPTDFHSKYKNTMEVKGNPETIWLLIFFKISYLVFHRRKKRYTGLEWLFWMNYPLKTYLCRRGTEWSISDWVLQHSYWSYKRASTYAHTFIRKIYIANTYSTLNTPSYMKIYSIWQHWLMENDERFTMGSDGPFS